MIALPWIKARVPRKAYRVAHVVRAGALLYVVQSRRWFAVGWTDEGRPCSTRGNAVARLLELRGRS